jgi:hypothetical protein
MPADQLTSTTKCDLFYIIENAQIKKGCMDNEPVRQLIRLAHMRAGDSNPRLRARLAHGLSLS